MLGTVLGLLGGGVQGTGQYLAGRQQRKVAQQEMARQLQNAERAQQVSNQNISEHGASAAQSALAAGQQQRQQLMQQLQGQQLFSPSAQPQMNAVAGLRNTQQMGARAALGSYNDWALRQTIQGLLAQNELNKLYDQAVGDMALYDVRMNEAGNKYGALQGAGMGVSLAGGLYNAIPRGKKKEDKSDAPEGTTSDGYSSYAPGTRPYAAPPSGYKFSLWPFGFYQQGGFGS